MPKTFEEELQSFEKVIQRLSNLALFPKKLVVKGAENFVRKGPNIIVGNHVGSYKDVAVLFKVVPRPIFFTANKMIFNKDEFSFLVKKHLYRSMKDVGLAVHFLLAPFFSLVVRYISSNIAKVGYIPVDLYTGRAEAVKKCEEYLKQGRAIIALQGRGHFNDADPNPYVSRFRHGAAVMAFDLYKELRLDVPVTPMAIFGTHIPFGVPAKVWVNVGEPLKISQYWSGKNSEVVDNFRRALEKTVNQLFMEILRNRK
ncbi:MAG: 1-acyl-sn-glycerol-3-phosphate acyltransferase [Candidatus Aminicenantes bacterium]|jgi:1-acyl-sn-glycerol-3-phosphate acyltransferase|nr:1-acyl-sn-glycerol-3-phosphate acyltransferase [Candidatus Aminicenantes bacterium]